MDTPIIQKQRGLSPIWILPLIALCIGGWLLYTSFRDAGVEISIHFDNAEGITVDKTEVRYKGVAVGQVKDITIDDDLSGVNLIVMMEKKAEKGLVEGSKFWIVKPEISVGKVRGLNTLLSGSYIAIRPGTSTTPATHFTGLSDPPSLPPDSPGLHITLTANSLYSLQKGSPVYSKNLKIGTVQDYHFAPDDSMQIDVYIEPEFSHLIKEQTRFWNSSGISIDSGLQSGFNLRMVSLASLIYGGISCGTPAPWCDISPQAVNGRKYKLYQDFESAEYGISMTLKLASGEGIFEGKTRVMYRGLKAGIVKKIKINDDENHSVTAEILLDPRAESILKEGTRFWAIRPEVSIDGIRHLETIISGPYISFQPGSGTFKNDFTVENGTMPRPVLRPGRHYTLSSNDRGALETGTPVLYKNMVVGEISRISFGPDNESILTDILVYREYTNLVRTDSIFWNAGGLKVDAGLSHFNLKLPSIKTLLVGGIAFFNPKSKGTGKAGQAGEGVSFPLYDSYAAAAKAEPSLQTQGLSLQLQTRTTQSLQVNSPVLFQNISVGRVTGFRLNNDHRSVIIDILIPTQFTDLVQSSTRFYTLSGLTVNAGLEGVKLTTGSIKSLITGGISFFTPEPGKRVKQYQKFTLYEDFDTAKLQDKIRLTIHFDHATGIRDKAKIRYQGIEIGQIRRLRLGPNTRSALANAFIEKKAVTLFRETSRLRLVQPKVNLSGIRNLETIITGSYIDVRPGDGELRTDFTVISETRQVDSSSGLNIILETPRLGSLQENSPIYYRQVQVGRVIDFELSPTAQQVWVRVGIDSPYTSLIHKGTKFWLKGGIKVTGGIFSGFHIESESMESLVTGGIALATPEEKEMGKPAISGDHFTLYAEKENTWLDWDPEIVLNDDDTKRIRKPNPSSHPQSTLREPHEY